MVLLYLKDLLINGRTVTSPSRTKKNILGMFGVLQPDKMMVETRTLSYLFRHLPATNAYVQRYACIYYWVLKVSRGGCKRCSMMSVDIP